MGYPRKGSYALRPVKSTPSITLSTLDANLAISSSLYAAADGAYRLISVEGTWSISGLTVGEGPVVIGFAHGDYTDVEIDEALTSGGSISIGDKIENEQSRRLVRKVGTFSGQTAAETINNGNPIKTRLNWAIPIGKTMKVFAFNDGAQLTTGAKVRFNGLGWVKDY